MPQPPASSHKCPEILKTVPSTENKAFNTWVWGSSSDSNDPAWVSVTPWGTETFLTLLIKFHDNIAKWFLQLKLLENLVSGSFPNNMVFYSKVFFTFESMDLPMWHHIAIKRYCVSHHWYQCVPTLRRAPVGGFMKKNDSHRLTGSGLIWKD